MTQINYNTERVLRIAKEFKGVIKKTGIRIDFANFQKRCSLLQLKKYKINGKTVFKIDDERIENMNDKDILDTIIEDYTKAAKYVERKVISNTPTFDPLSLIHLSKHDLLEKREKKIQVKQSQIMCAAFCVLLRNDNYFIEKPTNKVLADFASSRYDKKIIDQLESGKKPARLQKEKQIRHILEGTGYGMVP